MTTKSKLRPTLLTVPPWSETEVFPSRPDGAHTSIVGAIDHRVVKRLVRRAGLEIISRTDLSNGTGTQYRLVGGGIVTMYNTERYLLQGQLSVVQRESLERAFRRT